jgi:hypothetical protein
VGETRVDSSCSRASDDPLVGAPRLIEATGHGFLKQPDMDSKSAEARYRADVGLPVVVFHLFRRWWPRRGPAPAAPMPAPPHASAGMAENLINRPFQGMPRQTRHCMHLSGLYA